MVYGTSLSWLVMNIVNIVNLLWCPTNSKYSFISSPPLSYCCCKHCHDHTHHFLRICAEFWKLLLLRVVDDERLWRRFGRLGTGKCIGESTRRGGRSSAPIWVTSPTQPLMIPQPPEKEGNGYDFGLLTGQYFWVFIFQFLRVFTSGGILITCFVVWGAVLLVDIIWTLSLILVLM